MSDNIARTVVETITRTARTGRKGDGKVFVLELASAVRIRTGECDDECLWSSSGG